MLPDTGEPKAPGWLRLIILLGMLTAGALFWLAALTALLHLL